MSARHRARLKAEEERRRQLERAAAGLESEEEEEEEEEEEAPKRGFAFLNGDSTSEEESSDEEEEEEEGGGSGKNKVQDCAKERDGGGAACCEKINEGETEEEVLEKAIAQAKAEEEALETLDEGNAPEAFFRVKDIKLLNPDNELGRKLGKLGAGLNKSTSEPNARNRYVGRRGGRRSGPQRPAKALFCSLNDHESIPRPPNFAAGGARMVLLEESPEQVILSFEASDTYWSAQKVFEHIQATYDPNQIMAFLSEKPFHIPGYMAMFDVYLQTSQLESAESMLRTALFIFESWVHPRFSSLLTAGRCRLKHTARFDGLVSDNKDDPSCGLNNLFLRLLFKSMMVSRRKHLCETAFATGLALLSLNPDQDPFHILVILDDLAIFAKEYEFVIKLGDANSVCRSLPNIAYTKSLALHLLDQPTKATEHAIIALKTFPGAFEALFAKFKSEDSDIAKDSMVQSALETCKQLSENAPKVPPVLERLYRVMAHTSFELWSSKQLGEKEGCPFQWLAFQATKVEVPSASSGIKNTSHGFDQLEKYASVRLTQFQDDTGAVNLVDDMHANGATAASAPQRQPNINIDESNLFNLFFQTMMPWAVLPPGNPDVNGGHDGRNDDDGSNE